MTFLNTKPVWSLLTLFAILLLHSACQKRSDPPTIAPSEFTKNQRIILGEKIQIALAFDEENFPVLPKIPPFDTSIYWYTQTLYNQVTNSLRIDNHSSSTNRWDPNKEWEIIILDSPQKNAFVIPGGNLYLSTGLLRSLETEHQLYYILAFEAILMNDRYLLTNLIQEFNTNTLSNVANGQPSPNGATSKTLAQAISELSFDELTVQEVDVLTADLICKSSRMDRLGIVPLLDSPEEDWMWLFTRPSISNRSEYIRNQIGQNLDCGSFQTNGGYQQYVLNHLE